MRSIEEIKEERGIQRCRIRRRRLIVLMHEQNHRCCYCGQETWHPDIIGPDDFAQSRWNRATLEHVIPLVAGGSRAGKHNLVMACNECNSARGEKTMEQFIEHITKNTPILLSKRHRKFLTRETHFDGKKGQKKAAKTIRLLLIALRFNSELFETVQEELSNLPIKKRTFTGIRHVKLIRMRVIENRMVF